MYPQNYAAFINRGLSYQKMGYFVRAAVSFEAAIDLQPERPQAYGCLAETLFGWSQQSITDRPERAARWLLREAARQFDMALSLGDVSFATLHTRGSIAHELADHATAVKVLQRAVEQPPPEHASTAAELLQHWVPGPKLARSYNQLGLAHSALGQLSLAAEAFERGLLQDPELLPLYCNYAVLLERQRDIAATRTMFQRGIDKAHHQGVEVPVALYNNLGLLEMEEGRYSDALKLFSTAQAAAETTAMSQPGAQADYRMQAGDGSLLQTLASNIQRAQAQLARSQQ